MLTGILAGETGYDTVIFDIGYLCEANLCLMRYCESIFVANTYEPFQQNMKTGFERLLIKENMQDVLDKLRYVDMRRHGNI